MESYSDDDVTILARSPFGMVQRCRSGGYHVSVQHVTLHLSTEGFGSLASLIQEAQLQNLHREIRQQMNSSPKGAVLDLFRREPGEAKNYP